MPMHIALMCVQVSNPHSAGEAVEHITGEALGHITGKTV